MVETISDKLLETGGKLVINFPVEDTEKKPSGLVTSRMYVFEVSAYHPYNARYTQLPAMNSGDSISFNYLGDTGVGSGEDVLRVEQDDFHILHFGYTSDAKGLRIYESISPQDRAATALNRKSNSELPTPEVGSNNSYSIGARIDDIYDPPATTERVSFRNDEDGEFLQFGFYAETDIAAGTPINLTGRGYKVLPVTDKKKQRDIVREAQKREDMREMQVSVVQVGGIGSTYRLGEYIPDEWKDQENYIKYEGGLV